ncbi:MAG: 6-phosphofructokinase [Erysipelotrichia bacterium]|jgi:6-phosphofructokinase 1|nr:6-phosphofructokinase [Bacilli bacterium]NLB49383.1 6-phosphofructokinase [Erysipelotrichia bacterium]
MIKKIAVLTSGGDAPGMNACVRSVIRTCLYHGIEPYVVYDGFNGLIKGDLVKVDKKFTQDIINRGGTIILTSRLPEFTDVELQKRAIQNLKNAEIDALIGIGGDGTFKGLRDLSVLGFPIIGIPATIDNDVASTDKTIGFDTALNTICGCVDKIKDTSSSHQRCSVIEVMGRHCGDLAIFSSIAEAAELTITFDHRTSEAKIFKKLKEMHDRDKGHAIVIVSERLMDVKEFAKKIEKETGFETRAEILGRLQRGGIPTAEDRILASRFGATAVDLLRHGFFGRVIGIKKNAVVDFDIEQALQMERDIHRNLINLIDILQ